MAIRLFNPSLIGEEYEQIIADDSGAEYNDPMKELRKQPHVINVGMTGSGKGMAIQRNIEDAYEKGYKIVSFKNWGREIEHGFKRYPVEGTFAKYVRRHGERPRGYPVRVWLPVVRGHVPKKIPPYFQLYTIPVAGSKAVNADLLSVISNVQVTDIGKQAIDDQLEKMNDDSNLADLYIAVHTVIKMGMVQLKLWFQTVDKRTIPSMHRLIFLPLNYRMMSHASHQLALTDKKFVDMLNDQKEISVFTQYFAPPALKPFL
ncbi:MAG: hypothetical protein ABIH23_20180, partial [bacterium]